MLNYKYIALEVRALQSEQVTYVICICYQLVYWLGKQCSRDGERTDGVTALYSWPPCIERHDPKQMCTIFWFKEKGAKTFVRFTRRKWGNLAANLVFSRRFAAEKVKVMVTAVRMCENAGQKRRFVVNLYTPKTEFYSTL
jgi:hypothetical protein